MNTKNNKNKQNTLIFTLILTTLLVLVSGCGNTVTPPANVSPSPTVEKKLSESAVSPTPTPNPAEAFYGEWETKDLATGSFETVVFGSATQKGDNYAGTVTDAKTNQDLFEYTIKPNNNLTLVDIPVIAGSSKTYPYEVSDGGNTVTLKGNPPMVFKRGTKNTDILKDAEIIADNSTYGDWKVDRDVACKIFPTMCSSSSDVYVRFNTPKKYNEGYNGTMSFFDSVPTSPLGEWKYAIIAKDKAEFNDGKGTNSGSYKIINNGKILQIDFVDDSDPDLYLTR